MDILDKIKSRILINENGCWEWSRALDTSGYGLVYLNKDKRLEKVHRVMFELHNGQIDKSLVVCHNCNNRKCCNPEHLRLDTVKSNIDDRMRDKKHHWTKLNREQVNEIFKLHSEGLGYLNISRRFNVSKGTIAAIIKKRAWNWEEIRK